MRKVVTNKTKIWTKRVAAFEASGQPRRVWCSAHGVNVHTLDYWRLRLRTSVRPLKRKAARSTALVPVVVRNDLPLAATRSVPMVELEWPSGLRLRTTLGLAELSTLIRAIPTC